MRPARLLALGLAFAAVALGVPGAALATPVPSAVVQVAFTMPTGPGSVWRWQASNCLIFTGGWSQESTQRFLGATERPRGLLDVAARTGEAIVPGEGIHVDRIFGPRPRAVAAVDVGVQLAGRRAYLTGAIRSVRSHSARTARRVRLALLHGATLTSRNVRGGLLVTVRGRGTMLRPLVALLNGLRCRGPRVDEHPIPANAPLGTVTATIVPARASAQPTTAAFRVVLGSFAPTQPHVEPTGGAQDDAGDLRFAVAPGTRVTAACSNSGCELRDGSVSLLGGFDVVDGDRRLSVTDLALSVADGRHTVTGVVGGSRIVIGEEPQLGQDLAFGDALKAQLAATFGDATLDGYLIRLSLPLGPLAPA